MSGIEPGRPCARSDPSLLCCATSPPPRPGNSEEVILGAPSVGVRGPGPEGLPGFHLRVVCHGTISGGEVSGMGHLSGCLQAGSSMGAEGCRGEAGGPTLKQNSSLTRKGKVTACRMRFSFSVCSICFSFTTYGCGSECGPGGPEEARGQPQQQIQDQCPGGRGADWSPELGKGGLAEEGMCDPGDSRRGLPGRGGPEPTWMIVFGLGSTPSDVQDHSWYDLGRPYGWGARDQARKEHWLACEGPVLSPTVLSL